MNFIINMEIYPFHLMCSFGESDKKLFKLLKKMKIPKKEYKLMKINDCRGKYIMFSGKSSLIRMPRIPKKPSEMGTLIHEITHCTCEIMRTVGIPLTESSEEAYTYLQGYLTEKIYAQIFDNIHPPRNKGVGGRGSKNKDK